MRVVVFVVVMLTMATTSEASKSCMNKTEARQHFGSVHLYWHGTDHCWDATSIRLHRPFVRNAERSIDQPRGRDSEQNSNPQESERQISERRVSKWRNAMSQAAMSKMMADAEPAQGSWTDRWVDIEPTQLPLAARWVDIAPVTPPPSKSAPDPELHIMVLALVLIVIALILAAIIEVLFRAARAADKRDQAVA